MSELKYTKDHEWLRVNEDGSITVGITDFAQDQLGDVVYVELPEINMVISADDEVAVIESVKAAGEIKVPLAGEVLEVNERLQQEPELVNSDPEGDGWFLRIQPESAEAMDELMEEDTYKEFIKDL